MPITGPAVVILGHYEGKTSPVRSPPGITYLMVTLSAGQAWTYTPPAGQDVAWLAVSHGVVACDQQVRRGQMAIFDGIGAIELIASPDGARFVIASAVPHPHALVMGNYSVHTNRAALDAGERRIAELQARLPVHRAAGPVPVFQG
ncbi:hypothetical protein LL972_11380 [Xanthomonas campestris pv. asclepiadis]|uniref:hypothetical protein n=1 Tax=Xanthomonas campestris TaxID=339 RepID=UPI001E366521|nr:hypothetical protein [Xanthomonas campestris]MCC4616595.1 hypothetical protein [Xanthomonas campestris pv. asclepiadis]